MVAKKKPTRLASASFEIDPKKLKEAQKQQKIYNKGRGTTNPNEKEIFLRRSGPQLPFAKRAAKNKKNIA